jgi:DNA-directed RNA polymerase specialized sigma24 family protein
MPMSSPGSVTCWIAQLKAGARASTQPLWERYFHQFITRARQRLAALPRRAADEEDVVLSAFDSFFRAAEQGRFPDLHDREDLWQLLVVLTDRKACDLANYERRQRRGGGKVRDEAALGAPGAAEASPLNQILGQEPSPDFEVLAAEELRRLLGLLGDPELQQVAVLKMQGFTVDEIAAQRGWVSRTVKRKLRLIRQIWAKELPA